MADHVSQLETTLKRVTQERDELARDVESLCLQSENFFSSSVLSERITLAEKQLAMTQTQVSTGYPSLLTYITMDRLTNG